MPKVEETASTWLAALYVDRDHRKKGIATMLVKKAIEEIWKLEIKNNIYLFTSNSFRVDFYKKFGWQEVKNITYKGVEKVVMVLKPK